MAVILSIEISRESQWNGRYLFAISVVRVVWKFVDSDAVYLTSWTEQPLCLMVTFLLFIVQITSGNTNASCANVFFAQHFLFYTQNPFKHRPLLPHTTGSTFCRLPVSVISPEGLRTCTE